MEGESLASTDEKEPSSAPGYFAACFRFAQRAFMAADIAALPAADSFLRFFGATAFAFLLPFGRPRPGAATVPPLSKARA